jgi:hypothetical protein
MFLVTLQCQLVLFYYCHYLLTNFEDLGCLGCDIVLLGEWFLILQRIVYPHLKDKVIKKNANIVESVGICRLNGNS